MKATIGIVGYGFVGKAVHYGFHVATENDFVLFDPNPKAFEVLPKEFGKDDANIQPGYDQRNVIAGSVVGLVDASDIIFVCVPTPTDFENYTQDLSIVESVVDEIAERAKHTDKLVVIKTTTLPGTTSALAKRHPDVRFAFNPEFLTEANFLQDFLTQDRIVLGGSRNNTALLHALYEEGWPGAAYFVMDSDEAELVKYGANCFLSVKVAYFNMLKQLCDREGLEFEPVREGIASDERIGPAHTKAPGPDGLHGFGGKCFPKDLVALIGLFESCGVCPDVLQAAWDLNLRIRERKDWESIEGAISQKKDTRGNEVSK